MSLPDVLQAVVLQPEDRLVLAFRPGSFGAAEAEYMTSLIEERGLSGRVLIVMGADTAIRATKAEGSTIGQCGDEGLTQIASGHIKRVWCHLAYGHTGRHSDGSATWSNER